MENRAHLGRSRRRSAGCCHATTRVSIVTKTHGHNSQSQQILPRIVGIAGRLEPCPTHYCIGGKRLARPQVDEDLTWLLLRRERLNSSGGVGLMKGPSTRQLNYVCATIDKRDMLAA